MLSVFMRGNPRRWKPTLELLEDRTALSTLFVDPSGVTASGQAAFTTIQAAVNASAAGDSIVVDAATYTENVTINTQGITLEGAQSGINPVPGRAESVLQGTIMVTASGVTVDGFTVTANSQWAIEVGGTSSPSVAATGVFVRNNIVTSTVYGIQIGAQGGPSSTQVSLAATVQNNLLQCGNSDIVLFNTADNTIQGNAINGGISGIDIYYSDNNTVQYNLVSNGSETGILLRGSHGNLVEYNDGSGNGSPPVQEREGSGGNTIRNNFQPLVFIEQATGQADPTNGSTVNFSVRFSRPVSDFTKSDVTLGGTAGATAADVTPVGSDGTRYNVAVSGMTQDGTVIITIPAGAAHDSNGVANLDSANLDNTVTIDRTPPSAPSNLVLDPGSDTGGKGDNTTSATQVTINGKAEAGSTVRLFDANDNLLGTDTADASGDWGIATGTLSEGANALHANATDAVGNVSSDASITVTVDTQVPAAPTNLALDPSTDSGAIGDNLTNATKPKITGKAEAGSTVELFEGTTSLGTAVVNESGDWSITSALDLTPDAAHELKARATDAAGNTGDASTALTVTIDTSPPAIPTSLALDATTDSGAPGDNLTNLTSVKITGKADAGSTVTLFEGATALGTDTADVDGNWGITTILGADAAHDLTARAKDAAGNQSDPSAILTVTVDTTPPDSPSAPDLAAASDSGDSSGDDLTNLTTPTFTGTAPAGTTVKLMVGTIVLGTDTASAGGTWSITSSPLGEGRHDIFARSSDAAGNSSDSAPLGVTIDTTRPGATINRAPSQSDPTATAPVVFQVVFNERVVGFTSADIVTGGTAGATTAVVVEGGPLDGTTYDVAVTGMTTSGTVTITFLAAAATDSAGNATLAPTLTDNVVNFTLSSPSRSKPRGIFATLVAKMGGKGRRRKKALYVRVFDAVTGELKREFLSPFQRPKYKAIAASGTDRNGDGIAETVVLNATRKRSQLTLEFPG